MDEELLRHVVARGQEQRRPEHAVEAQDVLRQQVVYLRPEFSAKVLTFACVRQCAQIIDERVDPHVDDLALVPGDRNAPGLARAAEAEVLQAAPDERACFVVTKAREDEVRPRVIEVEQGLLKRGELEEVVRLLDSLGHGPVDRALAVDQLVLRLERLTADAVEA